MYPKYLFWNRCGKGLGGNWLPENGSLSWLVHVAGTMIQYLKCFVYAQEDSSVVT